jgi:cytochrome c-type biogenesis protein CcmH
MTAQRTAAALVALALGLALPGAALAAPCPKTTLGDVEAEVMCPVCGVPLALAIEAPQALRERAFIERLIGQCRSKDQIKRALAAQFGDQVLALPGDTGSDDSGSVVFGARVLPWLLLAAATAGVGGAALRWRRSRGGARQEPAAAPSLEPRDAERLDADLERYE